MVGQNILEHPDISRYDMLTPTRAELDLSDYGQVENYLHDHQPDMVIHAAGRVGGIQANLAAPVDFLVANMDMGRNIVMAARTVGIKKLLNLGSSCMYPRDAINPLSEDLILRGQLEPSNEGYALAKVVTMRLCEYIQREDAQFEYKTLIPCNLYGRHDKFNPKHSHLIPAIIHKIHQAIARNQASVEIWGDGMARREFMYAGDLADAVLCSIEKFDSLPYTMNIGLGHDYTINEYYQITAEVLGYDGLFVHDVSKPVGMARKLVSTDKQTAWGWTAQTRLSEGIRKTVEFYCKDYLS
jgi:GDP-L-fucose synthase